MSSEPKLRVDGRLRLAGVVTLAAVLVMSAVAFAALQLSTSALRQSTEDRARNSAMLNARIVGQETERMADLTRVLAVNPTVVRALQSKDGATLARSLRDARAATDGLLLAAVADASGRILAVDPYNPAIVGRNFSFRDWYKGVQRESPYISNAYNTVAADQPKVYAASSIIRNAKGANIGVVTLAQSNQLQRFVDEYQRNYDQELTVIDRTGIIVAQSGQATKELGRSTAAGLNAALRGTASVRLADNGRNLVALEPVPKLGWVVISKIPTTVASERIAALQRTLVALIFTAAILLIGIFAVFYRILHKLERAERQEIAQAGAERERQLRHTRVMVEAERHRVAADLHDYVLQHLHASKMHLEHVGSQEALTREGADTLHRALELLSQSSVSTRRIMTGIEPLQIEAVGLHKSLEAMAERVARDYPIHVQLECDLTPIAHMQWGKGATQLYRVVTELTTNAAKHAQPTNIVIRAWCADDDVCITVVDDGTGFELAVGGIESVDALDTRGGGLGLVSTFDRMQLLQGTCHISSQMGTGTTAEIQAPTSSLGTLGLSDGLRS